MTDATFPTIRGSAAAGVCVLLASLAGMVASTFAAPGNLDTGFTTSVTGGIENVFAATVQPDLKILIGGSFENLSNPPIPTLLPRNNFARLSSSGVVESTSTFALGSGADSTVYCMAVQPDGKILIGGYFGSVNGASNTNRIARLKSDGTVDTSFNAAAGAGPNDLVHCIAVQPDGQIVIGGLFTTVHGQSRNRIARLNSDGSLESTATFNPGTGADDYVYTVAVQKDEKILLGGVFTNVNGQSRNRIARLNSDGSLESTATFNPGTGANNRVYCIALQPDEKILLGGIFTTVNGQSRIRIARLNSDGSVEGTGTFDPGSGANDAIFSLALQADGKVVVGGAFTTIGGFSRNSVTRLSVSGAVDTTFDTGTGADWDVNSVALQADGKVLLGGGFADFNGSTRNLLARLVNDSATQSLSLGNTQVQWLRGGAAPEVSQVTFELSTNGGSSWSALGGSVSRISGGWQLTGLSLPGIGSIRARGRTTAGYFNGSSGIVEQVQAFVLPTVATTAASSVTATGATLNGTVNANGSSATVSFDYGTSTAYGTNVAGTPSPVTGSSATSVAAAVSGLTAGTTYHFRVNGVSASGTTNGTDLTFITPDTTPPTGGNMTLTPPSPFNALAALTVDFASWTDPSMPLSYAVLVDDVVVSATGASASRNFTGPSAAGAHTLKGRIYDSLANFTEVTQNFTVYTAVESWRLAWFGSPADSGNGADAATPDLDGIANLLKYALLINPGSAGNGLLPQGQKRTYAEGSRLAIIFSRDPARNDISIYVEAADSPAGPWTTALASSVNGAAMSGSGLVGETDLGGGIKSVEVRDSVNIAPGMRRFIHIRVVH